MKRNDIRNLFKEKFKNRDCSLLVRPVEEEQDIQNLEELDDNQLRPEFLDQVEIIRAKIFKKVIQLSRPQLKR